MGCTIGVMKYGIFFLNFLFLCLGIFLITNGISIQSLQDEYSNFNEFVAELSLTAKFFIIAGIVITIISFFGCWGTFAENTCFLKMYAVFLLIILLVEVIIGLYVYFKRDAVEKEFINIYNTQMEKYDEKTGDKIIDNIQLSIKCCGSNGPQDWKKLTKIPPSCCGQKDHTSTCSSKDVYQEGCTKKIIELISSQRQKLTWLVLGGGAFEILILIFTIVVRNSIRDSRRMSIY